MSKIIARWENWNGNLHQYIWSPGHKEFQKIATQEAERLDGQGSQLWQKFQKAIDENFMREQHSSIWKVAQTPKEAIEQVLSTPLWNKEIRKFAEI